MAGVEDRRVDTELPKDKRGNIIRGRKFKYYTANTAQNELAATGTNVVINKVCILEDDDAASYQILDGANNLLFAGICDHVGSFDLDIAFDSSGDPIDGLKVTIAGVAATPKILILWQ
jgi:hypothetical protein